MNDLVVVQVLHSGRNLIGPLDKPRRRNLLFSLTEEIEQRSVRTELHQHAEHRGLCAHTLELDHIGVVQFAKVPDVRLVRLLHLLDGHVVVLPFADEDGSLSAGAKPLQVGNVFEGNFPVV